MILAVTLCTSILSGHAGCTIERLPLLAEVTPQTCAIKAQELLAQKRVLWGDASIQRFGCERQRRQAHV